MLRLLIGLCIVASVGALADTPSQAVSKKCVKSQDDAHTSKKHNTTNKQKAVQKIGRAVVRLIPKSPRIMNASFSDSAIVYLGVLISKDGVVLAAEDVVRGLGDVLIVAHPSNRDRPRYYAAKVIGTGFGYALLKCDTTKDEEFVCVETGSMAATSQGVYTMCINKRTTELYKSRKRISSTEYKYLRLASGCVAQCLTMDLGAEVSVGAPVFSKSGDLLGLCVMLDDARNKTTTRTMMTISPELIGRVYNGGIQYKQIDVDFTLQQTRAGECGATVYSSKSGKLKQGDVIVSANGIGVSDMQQLYWIVQNTSRDVVQLEVARKEESGEVVVSVEESVTPQPVLQVYSLFGVVLQVAHLGEGRVVFKVLYIEVDSAFARWLRAGDVILGANGEVFQDAGSALSKIQDAVQQHRLVGGVLVIDLLRNDVAMRQNITLDFEVM